MSDNMMIDGDRERTSGEVGGDAGDAHDVVSIPTAGGTDSESEEDLPNTPLDQPAAEPGENTAESDLAGLEGPSPLDTDQDGSQDAAAETLADAATAITGTRGERVQAELAPILAALVPTLTSDAGPVVAKGIMARLTPRARLNIARLAQAAERRQAGIGGNSGHVLDVVAKLLASGELNAAGEGDGATAVDGATIEQATAHLEVIVGNDDRVRIKDTTAIPWKWYCALRITFPSGRAFRGNGFLIGPRAVATAGHCVFLKKEGGWASKVEVMPGIDGSARPFGTAIAASLRSVDGWVEGAKAEFDYGCLVLPAGALGGTNLGQFDFATLPSATLLASDAVLASFPGDKLFGELWGTTRRIKDVATRTIVYGSDAIGGQSGAPVYVKRDGKRQVVGIHNPGGGIGNSAIRITKSVHDRLTAWSRIT